MYFKEYDHCMLCPRKCGANRNTGEKGACGETAALRVGRAAAHMWEEPCISGKNGSGTVFFSGCGLKCVYCQNAQISLSGTGKVIDENRLGQIFLELQESGVHNINLVTATHFLPHTVKAAVYARQSGLTIPIVYNSSGYENTESVKMLKDTVDIYLFDFKYLYKATAQKYSRAHDYPSVAKAALAQAAKYLPKPVFGDDGMLKKGIIVRHLCLPNHTEESKKIISYLYENYGDNIILSIMNQYTPMPGVPSEIGRTLTKREYDGVLEFCMDIGIENAYIQEGAAAKESYIPSFNGEGV